ncbi:fasciclin domain-containing protein [Rubrivivax albus]|uniref:Fasciclin domain-containing protein n=1 Tax=Rubrivivax albus TaxID=2499835 RepID=A0A3S2UQQ1_9BURK|nr:fasciclin domain-containing protein [Rubrivivax albus]RVT52216.1 fasciclin domain-containing protein [Rubrivivax albus]
MFKLSRVARAGAIAAALSAVTSAAVAAPSFAECRRTQAVEFPGTIVDAAIATPALSTLTSLVVAAGLADALSAPGDLTVFAPTDDAFAKIPAGVLGAIGSDPAVLTAVLTYHVVPGAADPRRAVKREVTTLQGQSLLAGFEKGTGASVNQSTVDCTAVRTTNGTVWIIDSVLLPQFR